MEREKILEKIRERIVGYWTSRGEGARAEDLAQETVMVLIEKYSHLDSAEDLLPLAFKISQLKQSADWRKRKRRGEDYPLQIEDLFLADNQASPEEMTFKKELLEALPKAMSRLKKPCQEIFRLQLQGLSLIEIIRHLGAPSGTIYAREMRCREKLRVELRKILGGTLERTS